MNVTAKILSEEGEDTEVAAPRTASYGSVPDEPDEDELGSLTTTRVTGWVGKIYPYGFLSQLKPLLSLAWPITIIQITQFCFGFIASIFCGHLGTVGLDVAALANSLINVTGISIAVGLSSACDTLFSQIYGSDNKKLLGVVLQRSLAIVLLAIFPLWAIHLNITPLLVFIGQDPQISKYVGEYLLIFMPGLLANFIFTPLSKFLLNQNIVMPSMIIGLVANASCALLHYLFLYQFNWGTWGSAIAQSASYTLMCLLTIGYIIISKIYKETWDGWDIDALQEWGVFFKLAISGLLMICIEWWSFEIGIFLTGILGSVELGAQSVIFQFEMIYYMFPLGISVSTSITVGQYLGSGHPDGAKTAARVGLTAGVVMGLLFAILFVALRNYLPRIFSEDVDVIKMAAGVLPILALFATFDAISSVSGGILRGCGLQHIGAIVVAFGYMAALGIGIPLMFLTSLKVMGFWIGLAIALMVDGTVYLIITNTFNWQKQVDKARIIAKVFKEEEKLQVKSGVATFTEVDDDETQSLIERKRSASHRRSRSLSERRISRQMSTGGRFQELIPERPLPLQQDNPLSRSQLVCRRLTIASLSLSIFIAGILVRLFLDTSYIDDMIRNDTLVTEEPLIGTTATMTLMPIGNSTL